MSFDLTDLHTLIVRAHDRHRIAIGKVMRVTLPAAANGKVALYKNDASPLELSAADRLWLCDLAAVAEQQTEVRWWTKGPWPSLRRFLVIESEFWEWLNGELSPKSTVVVPSPAKKAKRTRTRRKRARALAAIKALWPERVPDQSILGNVLLCKKVAEWLKNDDARQNVPHAPISDDTILRAAGRRSERK